MPKKTVEKVLHYGVTCMQKRMQTQDRKTRGRGRQYRVKRNKFGVVPSIKREKSRTNQCNKYSQLLLKEETKPEDENKMIF
jgi:hypothetical protein